MANLNLDFSSVQSNEIVLLDEGMYIVTLESIDEKTSATGKPMLLIRFREETTKTAIFDNYVLTENCLWKLKELLAAAGLECSGAVEIDTDALVGVVFQAKIVQEDYNGETRNKIKKVYAA